MVDRRGGCVGEDSTVAGGVAEGAPAERGELFTGVKVGLGAEELPEPGARPATCAVGVDGELWFGGGSTVASQEVNAASATAASKTRRAAERTARLLAPAGAVLLHEPATGYGCAPHAGW
jgi:hypothetical protein